MYKFWKTNKINDCFSVRLKKLRKASGMTQAELAEKIHISRSSISNYENGSREPNNETLRLLADIFDVLVDYLTGNSDIAKLPFEKDEIEDFHSISKRVNKHGNTIDISGISLEKKLAIIDYCEYIMKS